MCRFIGHAHEGAVSGQGRRRHRARDCSAAAALARRRHSRRPDRPRPLARSRCRGRHSRQQPLAAPITASRRMCGWCNRWRPGSICSTSPRSRPAITVCNAFGHETAIAEYVVMTMLALHHRLFEISGEFRERGRGAPAGSRAAPPHGEVRGSTLGIVGYGRVGREVARRAAPFGCRILAANRTPRRGRGWRRAGLPAGRTRPDAAAMRYGGIVHRARPRKPPD